MSNRELGFAVNALVDGAKASDYQLDGREIDLKVMSDVDDSAVHRTHRLGTDLPISTPDGRLVTLDSVASSSALANGPVRIDHRERERSITHPGSRPPRRDGRSRRRWTSVRRPRSSIRCVGTENWEGSTSITLTGTADKLSQAREHALRLELRCWPSSSPTSLMAALFESFLYPVVIMFSVPLATLRRRARSRDRAEPVHAIRPLDVLTMLGFIILVGTVVNNAILIVHQSLNHLRQDAMSPRDAIRESTRTRIRPIFMSVSTSLCGMLPLVLFPGAGSELYRGLGSVVVGGLAVSTLFTLFLVPALFSLVLEARERLSRRFAGLAEVERAG